MVEQKPFNEEPSAKHAKIHLFCAFEKSRGSWVTGGRNAVRLFISAFIRVHKDFFRVACSSTDDETVDNGGVGVRDGGSATASNEKVEDELMTVSLLAMVACDAFDVGLSCWIGRFIYTKGEYRSVLVVESEREKERKKGKERRCALMIIKSKD